MLSEKSQWTENGTMFVDLDWLLNASSPLSASAELLVAGRMPFLSPNQQCQSTEGKVSHPVDLIATRWHRCLLTLTTKRLLVTLGRVAKPLVSPLMPVTPSSPLFAVNIDVKRCRRFLFYFKIKTRGLQQHFLSSLSTSAKEVVISSALVS